LLSIKKNAYTDGCYRRFAACRARKIFAGAAEIAYDYVNFIEFEMKAIQWKNSFIKQSGKWERRRQMLLPGQSKKQ
jgi:hypothetical protein